MMNTSNPAESRVYRILALFAISAFCGPRLFADVNPGTVTVGNPGNGADSFTGLGKVDYEYEICAREITNAQWCEYLNKTKPATLPQKGKKRTPLSSMSSIREIDECAPDWCGNPMGIETKKENGLLVFVPMPGKEAMPVQFLTPSLRKPGATARRRDVQPVFAQERFVNWLNAGQPECPFDDPRLSNGPYLQELALGDGIIQVKASENQPRHEPGQTAQWFLPTANELYKAAYHYSPAGKIALYTEFPFASNQLPLPADVAGTGTRLNLRAINARQGDGNNLSPWDTTSDKSATSSYGVYNLGDNARELIEPMLNPDSERRAPFVAAGGSSTGTITDAGRIGDADRRSFLKEDNLIAGFRVVRLKAVAKSESLRQTASDKKAQIITKGNVAAHIDGDVWIYNMPAWPNSVAAENGAQSNESNTAELTTRSAIDLILGQQGIKSFDKTQGKFVPPHGSLDKTGSWGQEQLKAAYPKAKLKIKLLIDYAVEDHWALLKKSMEKNKWKQDQAMIYGYAVYSTSPFNEITPERLKTARKTEGPKLLAKVKESISAGIPMILYACPSRLTTKTYLTHLGEDHIATHDNSAWVVLGYNNKTGDILFTRSLCPFVEKLSIERIASNDLGPITTGLYQVSLK